MRKLIPVNTHLDKDALAAAADSDRKYVGLVLVHLSAREMVYLDESFIIHGNFFQL
jgi:hypothetical protein